MNRFLGRLATAGLVAVLPVAAAPGCTSKASDPPNSTAEYLPWEHNVPDAFVKDATVPGAQRSGVLIASRWVTRTGSVTETSPEGRALVWPSALPVHRLQRIQFTVPSSVLPVRVEIRQFAGPLNPLGAPTDDSQDLVCEKDPSTTTPCTYGLDPPGIVTVDLAPRAEPPFRFVVLYVQWYIPVALRPGGTTGNPVIYASWGFELRIDG